MNFRLVRLADLRAEPWRNGGGVTRTIAVEAGPIPAWRVSVADIDADGPYSRFEGYDRIIVPISGPPAHLDIDGARMPLRVHDLLRFTGESDVHCSIAGSVVALNVMVRREIATASVRVERVTSVSLPADAAMVRLLFVLDGAVVAAGGSAVEQFDCVQLGRGSGCALTGDALLVRIEIGSLS